MQHELHGNIVVFHDFVGHDKVYVVKRKEMRLVT
jgi:hypothetical protein